MLAKVEAKDAGDLKRLVERGVGVNAERGESVKKEE
jgi:hypothetical protein